MWEKTGAFLLVSRTISGTFIALSFSSDRTGTPFSQEQLSLWLILARWETWCNNPVSHLFCARWGPEVCGGSSYSLFEDAVRLKLSVSRWKWIRSSWVTLHLSLLTDLFSAAFCSLIKHFRFASILGSFVSLWAQSLFLFYKNKCFLHEMWNCEWQYLTIIITIFLY